MSETTLVVSGPALPPETAPENAKGLVVSAFKDQLKINVREEFISVAHTHSGPLNKTNRPIIVRLVKRSLKYDLVSACINLKPNLHKRELDPQKIHPEKGASSEEGPQMKKFQTQRMERSPQNLKTPQYGTQLSTNNLCWLSWRSTLRCLTRRTSPPLTIVWLI